MYLLVVIKEPVFRHAVIGGAAARRGGRRSAHTYVFPNDKAAGKSAV